MIEVEILLTFVYFLECTVVQCKDVLSIYSNMHTKGRPRYISALKKVVPDISRHYFDALNEREIGR
jgi:hypothetical protein